MGWLPGNVLKRSRCVLISVDLGGGPGPSSLVPAASAMLRQVMLAVILADWVSF